MNKSTIRKTKSADEIAQMLMSNFFLDDLAYIIAYHMDESTLKQILEDEGLDTSFFASTKKSKNVKKSGNWWSTLNEFNGVSYDRLKVDYAQLVDLYMKPNGDVVALYDMGDSDTSGKLEYMLKDLFGEANPFTGMDYTYDKRNLRRPQDFVVGNIYKSTKKSKVKKDMDEFDFDDYAQNKAPMVLNKLRDAVSVLPSYLTATSIDYGLMIGEYIIDIESGKNIEPRGNFDEVCQVLESAISMYVQYFEVFVDYEDEYHLTISLRDTSVPGGDSLYASTKKSKNVKKSISSDLADFGGRIVVSRGGGDSGREWDFLDYTMELENDGDESALDDLYEKIDSGQERFALHRNNGWDYDITVIKSTKKSYTPNYQDFRSMVASIRNTGNHNRVFKE